MSVQPSDTNDKASDTPPKPGHHEFGETIEHDDVFGEITTDGPNYRNVSSPSLHGKNYKNK